MKAIPALADADARDLRDYVREWHRRALPIIGTEPFDDTWADLVYGWEKVKFPKGQEPMTMILQQADSATLPKCAEQYDSPITHRLIRLCRELQRAAGDGPFFISCRKLAELFGIDKDTANRRLHMLEEDHIIKKVGKHTAYRARRYRYIGDREGARTR